jgi:predicted aconitase with swiveling domain
LKGRVLVPGEAEGPILNLSEPLSFWGGVDPNSGLITQPRHSGHGRSVAGTVLAMPSGIGSSSSSAVLLELIHNGCAPVALLMGEADAILALGVVVAREMGFGVIPVLECDVGMLTGAGSVRIERDGSITPS